MAFPVDEGVIMHYCTGDPLINRESHFTASFGSSWFRNCNCNFLLFKLFQWLVPNKQNGDLSRKDQNGKDNHLNGVQLHQG